jgi:hypothetical protein
MPNTCRAPVTTSTTTPRMINARVTTATANARGEDRRLEDGGTGLPCQPGIRSTGQ